MASLARVLLALLGLTLLGTFGYSTIEGWSLFDSLYMTVITLTTVGYQEVHDLSAGGRWFTMVFLIVGIGLFLYSAAALGEHVMRAQLGHWVGRKKMDKVLDKMRDHFIVCGIGRLGRSLCEQLERRGKPFVVIEASAEVAEYCKEQQWPHIVADATDDSALEDAGIQHARAIACTLPSDAENLFVVLSARLLCKDLHILSRATTEKAAQKLQRAGADRVISLYATGAAKMAQLMTAPHLEDLFEIIATRGRSFELAEIEISADTEYRGRPLGESGLREQGIMVVGIRQQDGELLIPPPSDHHLQIGEQLIAIGSVEAIQKIGQDVDP